MHTSQSVVANQKVGSWYSWVRSETDSTARWNIVWEVARRHARRPIRFGVLTSLRVSGDTIGHVENTKSYREFEDRYADNTPTTTMRVSVTRGVGHWHQAPHI